MRPPAPQEPAASTAGAARTREPGATARRHMAILFTAFEPSGDAHAAPVIAELRRRTPDLRIYAWGGPQMQTAGATVLEQTCGDAAMGLSSVRKAASVRRQIKQIRRWSRQYRVLMHVAVDSPAANFPICKGMKKAGARVVHLVAPQIWAWGGHRIRKLRRCTDLVLCLLPFEEQWFNDRDVPARFVGHPAINREIDSEALHEQIHGLPQGSPRLALFPGSRAQEVKANIRVMMNAYIELQSRYSGMSGLIVAADPEMAQLIRRKVPVFPTGLHMITGNADAAIAWCDMAFAVSGTMTLHIARHAKPMVGIYRTGLVSWLLSKVILRTPYRLLPNIIAQREIVPEYVPCLAASGALIRDANEVFHDSKKGAVQAEGLRRICQRYANKRPAEESAALILRLLSRGAI